DHERGTRRRSVSEVLGNHLPDHLSALDDRSRTTVEVVDHQVGIDADQVIERYYVVGRGHRVLHRIRPLFVALAVHQAALYPPARQQDEPALRPVIAAAPALVDLWRATHLPHHHDQG